MKVKLYHIDTLEYAGSIIVRENGWDYEGVSDAHLKSVTRGMPVKAVLANLAAFDLVYDVIED
jgi:hypothetical protein